MPPKKAKREPSTTATTSIATTSIATTVEPSTTVVEPSTTATTSIATTVEPSTIVVEPSTTAASSAASIDLKLPQDIFLYIQKRFDDAQFQHGYFVTPGTILGGMLTQTAPIQIENGGRVLGRALRLLVEPAGQLGIHIYISGPGVLPFPCIGEGVDIFQKFLFDRLNGRAGFPKRIRTPKDLEFQMIEMNSGPKVVDQFEPEVVGIVQLDGFHHYGSRFYGSVLTKDIVTKIIKRIPGKFITMVQDHPSGGTMKKKSKRSNKTKKAKKSKKIKKSKV